MALSQADSDVAQLREWISHRDTDDFQRLDDQRKRYLAALVLLTDSEVINLFIKYFFFDPILPILED